MCSWGGRGSRGCECGGNVMRGRWVQLVDVVSSGQRVFPKGPEVSLPSLRCDRSQRADWWCDGRPAAAIRRTRTPRASRTT